MTQVLYEGKEISRDIEILSLEVQDSCGDQLDAIRLECGDSEGQWSDWGPKMGDALEVRQDGYSSGRMWIDQIRQEEGRFLLGAVSLPPQARAPKTKSWENVTLGALAAEIAGLYGLELKLYGVTPYSYKRVDQASRKDFAFLRERARLEGCSIKLSDGALALYADAYMEAPSPTRIWGPRVFSRPPRFGDSAGRTYGGCRVSWGTVSGEARDPAAIGPVLPVTNLPVSSQGEAQRFAQNLLRDANKRAASGTLYLPLDVGTAGGNVIQVSGCGLGDGLWFVELARHDFSGAESVFQVHRCREGDL